VRRNLWPSGFAQLAKDGKADMTKDEMTEMWSAAPLQEEE
jgi:hypothetical protein